MTHAWLFANGGAASALSATGLIEASSGHAFAQSFVANLTAAAPIRIGDAILQAKQSMVLNGVSTTSCDRPSEVAPPSTGFLHA
jgi:hypothetical protein